MGTQTSLCLYDFFRYSYFIYGNDNNIFGGGKLRPLKYSRENPAYVGACNLIVHIYVKVSR